MTNPPLRAGRSFREASRIRKLIYLGAIIVLFTTLTFTGPLVRAMTGPTSTPARYTLDNQRENLDLNELSQGKADTAGAAARLLCTLTGSRGVAVTGLWIAANEKQKRHEWNEVELLVNAITTLQPRFRTPWLFQSWNLAYNVSVESDRPGDKYFYITRGIQLLANGERLNTGDPDMRYWVGFYYLNKFGVSDENNFLRSLLQMSCIDPKERDGLTFALKKRDDAIRQAEQSKNEVDRKATDEAKARAAADLKLADDARAEFEEVLEKFVQRHPQLVRRIKEILRKNRAEDFVEFIGEHRAIPSRFVDNLSRSEAALVKFTPLRDGATRFPILPVPNPQVDAEFIRADTEYLNDHPADEAGESAPKKIDDYVDNYLVARSWMVYAQVTLPDLPKNKDGKPIPSKTPKLKDVQRGQRIPKSPMLVIFRQYPARSQAYVSERFLKEGWYDAEGWIMEDESTPPGERWFSGSAPRQYGAGRPWAETAWKATFDAWQRYGEENGLLIDAPRRERMERTARRFRTSRTPPIEPSQMLDDRDEFDNEEQREGYDSHQQLVFLSQNLHVTNFLHFHRRAELEKEPDTVRARKLVATAERRRGNPDRAIETWQQGFALWRKVLRADEPPLTGDARQRVKELLEDASIMEDLYERYLRFKDTMREHRIGRPEQDGKPDADLGERLKWAACGVTVTALETPPVNWLTPLAAYTRTFNMPLDGVHASTNLPWFSEATINQVQGRLKTPGKAPEPPKTAPPTPGG